MAEETASKKDEEYTEDWEIEQKDFSESEESSRLSNNILWGVVVLVFVIFLALPFVVNSGSADLKTIYVNDIPIRAEGDPISAIKELKNYHMQGKMLEKGADQNDALHEIMVIFNSDSGMAQDKKTLFVGITDRTGIWIERNAVYIEGESRRDFWTAVWTFNTILSGLEIESNIPLFEVQDLLSGRENVYLIQDMENTCQIYSHVISAEGDILSSLGFRQAEEGFFLKHQMQEGGNCALFSNVSQTGECPDPSDDDFIIFMTKGDMDKISIQEDQITFEYKYCDTVDKISVILRDLLYPNIVSSMANVSFPDSI